VEKALESDSYITDKLDLLEKYQLKCFSISNHLVGQCVCDPIDERHKVFCLLVYGKMETLKGYGSGQPKR
jgi:hypothetical protein